MQEKNKSSIMQQLDGTVNMWRKKKLVRGNSDFSVLCLFSAHLWRASHLQSHHVGMRNDSFQTVLTPRHFVTLTRFSLMQKKKKKKKPKLCQMP